MANHLYWRLDITASQGGANFPGLSELNLIDTIGGPSVAINGIASASSAIVGAGFSPPSAAFDNNPATCWVANGACPQWIGYQFLSPVSIYQFGIRNAAPFVGESPIAFAMRFSDDGATWFTSWSATTPATWIAGEYRLFTNPAAPPGATPFVYQTAVVSVVQQIASGSPIYQTAIVAVTKEYIRKVDFVPFFIEGIWGFPLFIER